MNGHSAIGLKIRARRRALGLTQAALAERLRISTSYVNLIEANRRKVGGALLASIARTLDVDVDYLSGAAERRLSDDLGELAAEPRLDHLRLDPDQADELVARYPQWARAALIIYRAYLDSVQLAGAMSDRLSGDPALGDAAHQALSHITAIRSTAEILSDADADGGALPAARQRQFHQVLSAESAALSTVARTLVAALSDAGRTTRPAAAAEDVDDFLIGRNNYFSELEDAADALRDELRLGRGDDAELETSLRDYLRATHRVSIVDRPDPSDAAPLVQYRFERAGRRLLFNPAISTPTRRFQLARLAAELGRGDALRAVAAATTTATAMLSDEHARARLRRALSSYLAGALLLPYRSFHAAAAELRYDIDALSLRFHASVEQVCHRLVTLRRPDAEGVPFAFVRTDAAGFISKRFPLSGFPLPRYGSACPLWTVFGSFQTPGRTVRQLAEFPNGGRYLMIARTVSKRAPRFHAPELLYAVMLACDTLHADRTVYARGLDLNAPAGAGAIPVGPSCRLCPRGDCQQRQEQAISAKFSEA